jgi:GT2 family glycosyltransferase
MLRVMIGTILRRAGHSSGRATLGRKANSSQVRYPVQQPIASGDASATESTPPLRATVGSGDRRTRRAGLPDTTPDQSPAGGTEHPHPRSLSIIIPAFNEETNLPATLRSIHVHIPSARLREVIVVDNGSLDQTRHVAATEGAHVVVDSEASLGKLRNIGAQAATGDLLLFLDADISITNGWVHGLETLDRVFAERGPVVSGSKCRVPPRASWVPTVWEGKSRMRGGDVEYLGAAHLIVPTATFRDLGGFDTELQTGEDYEFCRRARHHGVPIISIPELKVVHRGEPSTLAQFFRRELWHGAGDAQGLATVLRSRVALAALGFFGLHLLSLAVIIAPGRETVTSAALALAMPVLATGAVVVARGPQVRLHDLGRLWLLTYLYLWARFLALLPWASKRRWR